MGMGMSIGCCCGCTCPANIRAFSATDGTLLWEAKCFSAIARSPDNTLWGYSIRKISAAYKVRTVEVISVSTGAASSGSGWPAKSGAVTGSTTAIACDLVKIESDGTKTVTKADFWERAAVTSTDDLTWYKSCPRMTPSSPGTRLYDATDSGVGRKSGATACLADNPFPVPGTLYVNDVTAVQKTCKFTIPSQAMVPNGTPTWNFKQGGTTASWSLYADASTVETALATLPGVDTVSVTGGPCCESALDIHIEWLNATDTFSDAWVKSTTSIIANRTFWDWSTGEVSLISNSAGAVTSFTSDSLYILRATTQKRAWTTSGSHPWNEVSGTNTWSNSSMAGLTQTCERNKIGSGTTWDAVPIGTSITDVRDGVVLISQTRGRVPVVEPSGNAAYSHATIDETDGTLISLHDSRLNVLSLGYLDTDGTMIANGEQYGYTYQGFDGPAPPTGSSFSSSLGSATRCHDGYSYATGAGTTMHTFSLATARASYGLTMTGENVFSCDITPVEDGSVTNLDASYVGVLPTVELRIAGTYLTCRWIDVGAVRRETWMFFSPAQIAAYPSGTEWRFTHIDGGSVVLSTSWFTLTTSAATVEAELDSWYGDGDPGVPTIFISGTVEENDWQTQPFFQYLPLAHIEIWNDATGSTWAPRGRVLGLEIRNATIPHNRAVVALDRSTGEIIWQRDAGAAVAGSTWSGVGEDTVGGYPAYSDDSQVVVATQCVASS